MLKYIIFVSFISVVSSKSLKWTAELPQQYPGITPFFSRTNNSIVITSLLQDSNRIFHLLTHQYSIYGKLESKCDLKIPNISKRIWDLKIQHESDSSLLAFSWLYSNGVQLGVRVFRINVEDCNLQDDIRVTLYQDVDLVLYVPYYLVPQEDSGRLFLFFKSTEICQGVCRFEIGGDGHKARKDGTFTTASDDSLIWQIIPVNPFNLSHGYYYITEDSSSQLLKIEKLNSSGTSLRTLQTSHNNTQDSLLVSNSHARLSFCSLSSCFLFNTETFESTLNVSTITKVNQVLSTPEVGIIVIKEDDILMKFNYDNSSTNITLFSNFDTENKCYPRKIYQIIEFEKEELYCVGRPCMYKTNETSILYQVSVNVECFEIPSNRLN